MNGDKKKQRDPDFHRNVGLLSVCFIVGGFFLYRLYSNLPPFTEGDLEKLQVHGWSRYLPGPASLSDVKELKSIFMNYRETHYESVITGFVALYVFMQVFAIPGTIFLSVLAGPLFGIYYGLFIVSLSATSGSALSFTLSQMLGRPLLAKFMPQQLAYFHEKIEEQRKNNNLFWYILFLRMTPVLPNVFINITSPIVGVPLMEFFFATLLGLMPANYLHCNTGLILSELSDDSLGPRLFWAALKLLVIGSLALVPTLFKKNLQEKAGLQDFNKKKD